MNHQDTLLDGYIDALTRLTNILVVDGGMSPDLAADALLSGGTELLRKVHGAAGAADRLRHVADAVERENVEVIN